MKKKNIFFIVLFLFVVFDFLLWQEIFSLSRQKGEVCFFSVGQGDAEMISFSKKVVFLVDAGPRNNQLFLNLSQKLPLFKKRIDLVILSHPDADHFGGLLDINKRYEVASFVWNGQEPKSPLSRKGFKGMIENFSQNKTKMATLFLGDRIVYENNFCQVIWPPCPLLSKKTNENSLVLYCFLNKKRVVFAGDIGKFAEKRIWVLYQDNLKADILKFPHHGSKNSLEKNFLLAVKPKISVIEVGKNNIYHFPSQRVINFLGEISSQIRRTDKEKNICFSF